MAKSKKTGGMQKGYKYKISRIWITNDIEEHLINKNVEILAGYHQGRLKRQTSAWNKGMTKDTNATVKKISDTLKALPYRPKYSDAYLLKTYIDNNVFKDFWTSNSYIACCKHFNLSEQVVRRIIKLANLESPQEHRKNIKNLTYTEEWRKKQSKKLQGKNTWSKGSKHSYEQIEKQKTSYKNRSELDKRKSKEKEFITRQKNKSYLKHITLAEKEAKDLLLQHFNSEDICYQYFDKDRYPFTCDFYIKSQDLFIEINAYPSHGGKAFDPASQKDQIKLQKWKNKSLENKPQYENWIYTWSDLDVRKRAIAIQNKLNYFAAYSKKSLEEYLNANF